MADIFIGYASEDRPRVKLLAEALEAQGWSVWWDWKSIPVGKTWRQAIEEGLEAARSVLVLWSDNSIGKDWVIDEADFGKERKILVPVNIDDVRPPIGFRQIQAARLLEWQGEESHTGFKQIVQALTAILGSAEPEKATELESSKNRIGMEFVLIPAGIFMMGGNFSPEETGKKYGAKIKNFQEEHPQHVVTISKPLFIQITQVTQSQWQKVIGENPSQFIHCGEDCPVERVSWYGAKKFIFKLNEKEGTNKYRLPTEAEWEYACRAGTTTEFFFGDDAAELDGYAWYQDNSDKKTHPVGKKKPNNWGLHDMHGNVWEWCQDWYGGYPLNSVVDPKGPDKGIARVLRGGSWGSGAMRIRSAYRLSYNPDYRSLNNGFRVARDF